MSTVAEIKTAFAQLPEPEAREVADWIQEVMESRWDRQMDDDIAGGKLDKLAEQALSHYHAGRVKPLHELLANAPASPTRSSPSPLTLPPRVGF